MKVVDAASEAAISPKTSGSVTRLIAGKRCELEPGHGAGETRIVHRNGGVEWVDVPKDDSRDEEEIDIATA